MAEYYIKALDTTLLILYCTFIYWLSDQPSLPTPALFTHQDKLFHAGAYFIMAAFALRAFRHNISSLTLLVLTSLVFSSLYGLSDEWHQSFIPGRMSDVADWLADTVGAFLFLGLYRLKHLRQYESC
ncbi:MAG: VanZ family protein [Gammaproteobacteria bacterium]|nr:MAG: VanZ family protein [Gammaproteobacteria bacterium]